MTDVSEIAERLRAVLNDGLSSVAICNKNDLRAILDDRERLMKERDEARAKPKRAPVEGEVGEQVNLLMNAERLTRADQRAIADLIQRLAGQVAEAQSKYEDAMIALTAEATLSGNLQARLREAVEVMRPFAVHGEYVDFHFPDDGDDVVAAGLPDNPITLGHFRRARAFLATLEDHSNG